MSAYLSCRNDEIVGGQQGMQAGTRLGRYMLDRLLGENQFKQVWLATIDGSAAFQANVVIKILRGGLSPDDVHCKALSDEGRIGHVLSHPSLVRVYEVGHCNSLPFVAREYVHGRSFAAILAQQESKKQPLHPWFVLSVFADICNALQYAHEHSGSLHGKIRPAKVLVSYTGEAKLLDFGHITGDNLAGSNQALLTPQQLPYTAPECFTNGTYDLRSDVYALGVLLYRAFTGTLPYLGSTDRELAESIVQADLVPPSSCRNIDRDVEAIIVKAMSQAPQARHTNPGELAAELASCVADRAPTQDDRAMLMGALFSEAKDVPNHIRKRLARSTLDLASSESEDDPLIEITPDVLVILSNENSDDATQNSGELAEISDEAAENSDEAADNSDDLIADEDLPPVPALKLVPRLEETDDQTNNAIPVSPPSNSDTARIFTKARQVSTSAPIIALSPPATSTPSRRDRRSSSVFGPPKNGPPGANAPQAIGVFGRRRSDSSGPTQDVFGKGANAESGKNESDDWPWETSLRDEPNEE